MSGANTKTRGSIVLQPEWLTAMAFGKRLKGLSDATLILSGLFPTHMDLRLCRGQA